MTQGQRFSVVGNSGSGKSSLARSIGRRLGIPVVELDAIHHLRGWNPIDPAEFERRVLDVTAMPAWVVDGNYRLVVVDGPVWQQADTVVWLDLPRRTVMRQVVGRTLRRTLTREELWNGNREPLSNLWQWDPERSIIRWSWTQHAKYSDRYEQAMRRADLGHLTFVRLTSHAAADEWLAGLDPSDETGSTRGR